jgi:hypothetical protein
MLEARVATGKEVVNDRQVQYTNLAPGPYRFRVTASNNSGVWNDTGATLDFSIAPAYYQTRWFASASSRSRWRPAVAGVPLPRRHVARQYNRTLDDAGERANPHRTRPARYACCKASTDCCCDSRRRRTCCRNIRRTAKQTWMARFNRRRQAITEGRDAVQGLRTSTVERNDLAVAIRTLGDGLASQSAVDQPPTFTVAVEGQHVDLHPIVRDEIYKIAAEALRNAFPSRACRARRSRDPLRRRSIPFARARRWQGDRSEGGGRPGARGTLRIARHAGTGCSDRGKLAVWSEVGAGTEVELRLPARTGLRDGPAAPPGCQDCLRPTAWGHVGEDAP